MTTAFLFFAALMLVAALAFVLVPLLRGRAATDAADETRRKLKALETAKADGILTAEEYAAKRAALGEELLASAPTTATRTQSAFYSALAVALLLPAAAILLYRELGAPAALDPANLIARAGEEGEGHAGNIDAAIAQLAEKMKQDPSNAEGWTLLGRAYKSTQRFAQARDALKHAHDLAPDDGDIAVDYAEAIVLAGTDRRIQGEALALIEQAIKANPQNQKGLWLAGIADSQAGKYDDAIAKWNTLLPLLPPDSDVATSIREQIAQAQALRDGKPMPAPAVAGSSPTAPKAADDKQENTSGPHISVKVALDPKLKDKVAPGDTLFVFAKAASGPPMPLAIAKLTAAQLPASVVLTDAMSMMPQMKLSTFPQIIIGARISKSGQAIAQSGDLQTLSAPLPNTRGEPVELTIDQVVP
ncbi:MAG: c-type cytochrome biogenesis protein CcmI [Rudaea sp.]|uniref:c-type cytochrome biogenesis protein CcmI n=1 Tax=unclassified Rudaea TaxID=2627037 RepID=UPI0010F66363|nr:MULTISPECIES: c-type cytochrome biogenesis protein CcmI [unclassified Rudaea]MBN8884181.1 c-type cytochrome biogenesis protein CcmI [Rudaea sp.]